MIAEYDKLKLIADYVKDNMNIAKKHMYKTPKKMVDWVYLPFETLETK
jgi:hypothetical protein